MKKTIAAFLALGLIFVTSSMLFASGATEASGGVAKIQFFSGKAETVDWMNALIGKFNAANPTISVTQEFQKDASNVIKVKLASGDVPDISTVYTQDYADQGFYVDLTGESAWWNRLSPAIRALCTDVKSGKQYRIATNITMAGLFYNKQIFSDLGLKEATTWNDFVRNLETIRDKRPGTAPIFMGGKDSWMLGHLIEFMAHGVIKEKLGTVGAKKAMLADNESLLQFGEAGGPMDTFAKRFLQLRDEKLFNQDLLTATYDNQLDAFASGKAAMISQGMWALSGILDRNKSMGSNIGFSPYPPIVDGMKPTVLSAEDSAYTIMSASKHQTQAKTFLSYLFQQDNQKAYSEYLKEPSAFTDVDADWGPIKAEVAGALKAGVNIGFTNEAPAGFSGDDAGRMVQDLYAGKYATSLDFAKAYAGAWDTAYKANH